jgi:hypothetical protein
VQNELCAVLGAESATEYSDQNEFSTRNWLVTGEKNFRKQYLHMPVA